MSAEEGDPLQIVIAGLAGSGKTTFSRRMRKLEPDILVQPTISMDVHIESYQGVEFFLYDLGGQESFLDTVWPITLSKADALIYVIDSAFNQDRKIIRENLKRVLTHINKNIPMLILANKQDLPFARDSLELDQILGIQQLLKEHGISKAKIFNVSALRGDGTKEAIDWLMNQVFATREFQEFKIHNIYVYNRDSGLPLAYLHPEGDDETTAVNEEADQATLISAFYAALNNLSNDLMQSHMSILTLRKASNTHEGRKTILLNHNDETTSLSCLIVAEIYKDLSKLEDLSRLILNTIKKDPTIIDEILGTLFDLRPLVIKILQELLPNSRDLSKFFSKEQAWVNSLNN